jgi:type I restriction enzyme S subunit
VGLAKLESEHAPRKSIPVCWESPDVRWIRLQDIRAADGKELFSLKYMTIILGIQNSSARLLPKGTVCLCRDISFAYVTIIGREMATTQHFANWICDAELDPKFLMLSFMVVRDFLAMSGQGTTVKKIPMRALKQLQLATPQIPEQHEIVRRVETLFAFADCLEACFATARTAVDRCALKPSAVNSCRNVRTMNRPACCCNDLLRRIVRATAKPNAVDNPPRFRKRD